MPLDSPTFTKRRAGAHPDFFAAEAAGLAWLREGGAPVVDVIDRGGDFIELARLEPARPSVSAAREFGTRLARMHDAGADRFGSPPNGFTGQLFIGSRPMSSTTRHVWGEFYVAERVLPFLRIAVDAGNVTSTEATVIERACSVVASGVLDDGERPSRLHGDLWSGNVFWSPGGVVLIDPAAHGGHRETDLAMLALFGCSFLNEIIESYDDAHPLRPGVADRVPVHQLHPLAVHAAGHGRSYGVALAEAAESTLAVFG
ncbi:fructosamine kinase [Rhodococcoides trifolii]|uniref:Fructosamine kinase n=1 Tax=Rhodococcoides trifolii TaxID=908250 RepID=A0A917FVS6_9NOCA|nr:fructosamine kinase family protein [Rhodococcus trifolii]GGG05953.1 fructosamine kinase [Rhodococcus trifolii]